MKISELPFRFRAMAREYPYDLPLMRLGDVKPSTNPYFAVEEQQVANRVVRYLGSKPNSPYEVLLAEREDGTVWRIRLGNFVSYEVIDSVEKG